MVSAHADLVAKLYPALATGCPLHLSQPCRCCCCSTLLVVRRTFAPLAAFYAAVSAMLIAVVLNHMPVPLALLSSCTAERSV